MEIHPVTLERLDDVADLFNSNGATRGCWCMFFLMPRQEYYRGRRGGNETKFRQLTADDGPPPGLIAYRDGTPVGWVSIGPRSRYQTAISARSVILRDRNPAEDDDVWLVPCFFVRVGARRARLTHELLSAAVEHAARAGAKAIEGWPLAAGDARTSDAFLGKEHVFRECGFTEIARPSERRVVMRKDFT